MNFGVQAIGTGMGIAVAVAGGAVLYGVLKAIMGLRLTEEQEFDGSDRSIHNINATPEAGGW